MKINANRTKEFTLIEFFLSSVALFLLVIILLPLFEKFELSNQKAQIRSNLAEIRFHADLYFEETDAVSVSLYQLTGPKKVIPNLKSVAGESYPEVIYRNEALSVQTEKFGRIYLD